MKNRLSLFVVLCSGVVLAACNDDTVGPGSGTEACTASEDCDNGMCVDGRCVANEEADKCATVRCESDEHCNSEGICVKNENKPDQPKGCADGKVEFKGECVDPSLICGEVVCEPNVESCVNGECVSRRLCGEVYCAAGELCHLGQCHAAGECGGLTCLDGETCVNDVCHKAGDCGGVECIGEEVCYNDSCRPMGNCGSIQCTENEYCLYETCLPKEACGESYCEGDEACVGDVCEKQPFCIESKMKTERCGDACCGVTQFCGKRSECCEKSAACGFDCCGDGEVCEGEVCHKACEFNRCATTDGTEMCCAEGEVCASNQCFKPVVSCIDNYMCENDQYCDSAEHLCLPKPAGEKCMSTPKGGEVKPTTLWYWGKEAPETFPQYTQVMSSPMVADVNNDSIPEVVFNSYLVGNNWEGHGIVRVLNGKTGELIVSSDGQPFTDGGSMIALGNLDDDPEIEIVTCAADYKLIAYDYIPGDASKGEKPQLKVKWHANQAYMECGQSGPGIADFDGDGKAEVYGRYTIHNGQTGEVIAHVACSDNAHTHIPCDYSVALDLDGDGVQELVGGNVVFNVDIKNGKLTERWRAAGQPDGYPAVGNLDLDPEGKPELVVVRNSNATLMAYDALTGDYFWEKPVSYSVAGGGTPTIANMNDTPEPEIAFAGKLGNIVLDYQGKELWTRGSHDTSSGKTGSSVFDFDGDGKAEVVYADEFFLRVYDGETGKTRFCKCNTNCTHYEYPVIADVDADGHAEILISANTSCNYTSCKVALTPETGKDECVDAILAEGGEAVAGVQGVRAFASPTRDWVNTRKVYNQHAYNVTNVSDDASIPMKPKTNWTTQGLNNFRLNVQPGANYLPDLEIREVSSQFTCPDPTPLYFRVQNVGWATALAGVPINIFAANEVGGAYKKLGTVNTTKNLRSGEGESLKFDIPAGEMAVTPMYIQIKFGDDAPEECRSDNNTTDYVLECYKPIY